MDHLSNSVLEPVPFDAERVVVLAGPTSSGKSDLAMSLCDHFPAEIVCMDSMQLYRELRIGTGRPEPDDEARVPHHLFGCTSVHQAMSPMRYAALAAKAIAEIQQRGRVAVLVGGTGLYMKALFQGLDDLPATPAALRVRLEQMAAHRPMGWHYRLLQRLDPEGAAHLHPNDSQRIQRFLEVRLLTGRSLRQHWSHPSPDGPLPCVVGLEVERNLLRERIARRVGAMLDAGWCDEVRSLQKRQLLQKVCQIGPIGYQHIADYFSEKKTYEQMRENIVVSTRRYAKRQMTWFRKVPYIQWFPWDPDSGYNVKVIAAFMKEKLG